METGKGDTMKTATPEERVTQLENLLNQYYLDNYGPLWGEDDEKATTALREELTEAYNEAGTPELERIEI